MTLSRILENVQKKGKIPESQNINKPLKQTTPSRQSSTYSYDNGERKIIDPVVARLKEARRLEREKKEQEAREKKGLRPKKPTKTPKATIPLRQGPNKSKSSSPTTSGNGRTKSSRTTTGSSFPPPPAPPARSKPTKMNFNELMKKASSMDQNKLSISYKAKSRSPESDKEKTSARSHLPSTGRIGRSPQSLAKSATDLKLRKHQAMLARRNGNPKDVSQSIPNQPRVPLPTRGPSEKLAQKLKGRSTKSNSSTNLRNGKSNHGGYDDYDEEEEDEDDDMDSFIASDEEDQYQEGDYDRDEIWAMFNRGKSRSAFEHYDDYDSDDMEATGAEIFEEENKSKRRAEIEDRKELEEEQRRAELKKQRKLKSMQK